MKMLQRYDEVLQNCGPVPPGVYDAITRYVESRIQPGGFVEACLANDFAGAVSRADTTNCNYLPQIVMMLQWAVPSSLWGSWETVRRHLAGEDA